MLRRLLLMSILFTVVVICYSQKPRPEIYIIVKAGTTQLTNGVCKIQFNNLPGADSYYVVLTPSGKYSELFISEKKTDFFIIKSQSNKDAEFDYAVYVKPPEKKLPAEFDLKKKN